MLYKKDTKGKIRTLEIFAQADILFQVSGLIDGAKVTNQRVCKSKNVGRANATTAEEQAIKEAESKIKAKLDEGYFLTLNEAENEEVILPMLAKDFKKEVRKVTYPCFVQPKLDGMRALGRAGSMISRKGKTIDTMGHILKDLEGIAPFIDGELYAHGLSFQENMKLIKKDRGAATKTVKYHVYDLVSSDTFFTRYKRLNELITKCENIELVPTFVINNEEDLKSRHAAFIKEGYEGTIVRWGTAPYKVNGRSSNLLKYKDFKDMACEVIDVIPSDARPEQGVIVCKGFRAGLKFSHAEREEILRNKHKYIGQTAEIRYFEETDDGLPRFPVCVGFRLDK